MVGRERLRIWKRNRLLVFWEFVDLKDKKKKRKENQLMKGAEQIPKPECWQKNQALGLPQSPSEVLYPLATSPPPIIVLHPLTHQQIPAQLFSCVCLCNPSQRTIKTLLFSRIQWFTTAINVCFFLFFFTYLLL